MMTRGQRMQAKLMHTMRGITLIELMIVVVIIGFMAVIAYPNYRDFAARAKRNEAKAALLQIATNQERFYLQNNTYTCDMTRLGFPVSDDFVTDSGTYTVDISSCTADNFVAAADYIPSDGEESKCNLFQINGRNVKTSSPYTDCWTRTR
jgi:type IV pilus assembly protein PilE